ncbi:MAG: RNA recognition motif domain-containing protein [Phycisphaerae bacterium]
MANIYVGNLSPDTTEQQLTELFGAHGTVQRVSIITDRLTGRSRGFGFVEMPNATEAQAAIAALNGTDLGGRALTVNEARPRPGRTGRTGGRGESRGRGRRW